MDIAITGNILRDKSLTDRRNYVNLVVVAKNGAICRWYHIRNYQVNSSSLTHRMILTSYSSNTPAMTAFSETNNKKLGRNRSVHSKVADTFEDTTALEKELNKKEYRITMVNIRKLMNRINHDLVDDVEDEDDSFDDRMEKRIADSEDFDKVEKKAGIGKGTADKVGDSWGMF